MTNDECLMTNQYPITNNPMTNTADALVSLSIRHSSFRVFETRMGVIRHFPPNSGVPALVLLLAPAWSLKVCRRRAYRRKDCRNRDCRRFSRCRRARLRNRR